MRTDSLLGMLAEQPHDPFLTYALATEYRKLGKLEEALTYYIKTLDLDPAYSGAYYHLASLYSEMGLGRLAMESYDKGISLAREKNDRHALSELLSAQALFLEGEAGEV